MTNLNKNLSMQEQKNKILLHACCAICSAYPVSYLKEAGYEVVVYFYNPNIHPIEEYLKRLEAEREICKFHNVELIEEVYEPDVYFDYVKGFENEPEKGARCTKCFELRLNKTAQKAKELGIKHITTTMVISPHKNFQKLSEIGLKTAEEFDLIYEAIDFKKRDGFLKTNQISKSLSLYRQNYCGCKFSIRK